MRYRGECFTRHNFPHSFPFRGPSHPLTGLSAAIFRYLPLRVGSGRKRVSFSTSDKGEYVTLGHPKT